MDQIRKVTKAKCLNSLEFHTRYFFKKQYGSKYIIGDHHRLIFHYLERVLSGECTRLIIKIAPRYGKTELAVKSLISHGLSLNPSAKFIHLSYGDDIALDNSEMIKDLIQSDYYQEIFPEVVVKKDAKAKDKWYTTEKGGVLARSAAGQVTGFGAGLVEDPDEFLIDGPMDPGPNKSRLQKKLGFSGAIIIDDPIKPEDAFQDTIREKVNMRFDSTIRNRVNSRKTPIIVIMQSLHPRDLTGYLTRPDEQDEWEVLSIPCILDDKTCMLMKDVLGVERQPGEALWEFKHTLEELLKMKRANEIVFMSQYMQDPKPRKGLMFPLDDLNFYDPKDLPEGSQYTYIAVDPANQGGDDFAAISGWLIDSKIYIHDVLYNLEGADVNEGAVIQMAIDNKAHGVGVEGVFGWKETAVRIREGLSKRGFDGEVRVLRPRSAKHVRISARSSFIRNNFYFRKDYESSPQYFKFMQNLTSYKKVQEPGNMNKHDEAPDVCEMVAGFFEKQFPELWEIK